MSIFQYCSSISTVSCMNSTSIYPRFVYTLVPYPHHLFFLCVCTACHICCSNIRLIPHWSVSPHPSSPHITSAFVAQLVARAAVNRKADGSSPSEGVVITTGPVTEWLRCQIKVLVTQVARVRTPSGSYAFAGRYIDIYQIDRQLRVQNSGSGWAIYRIYIYKIYMDRQSKVTGTGTVTDNIYIYVYLYIWQ